MSGTLRRSRRQWYSVCVGGGFHHQLYALWFLFLVGAFVFILVENFKIETKTLAVARVENVERVSKERRA